MRRFQVLRPHLHDGVPLTYAAAEARPVAIDLRHDWPTALRQAVSTWLRGGRGEHWLRPAALPLQVMWHVTSAKPHVVWRAQPALPIQLDRSSMGSNGVWSRD